MNITKVFLKLNRIDPANLLVFWMLKEDATADVSAHIPKLSPKFYVIDGTKVRPKKAIIELLIQLSEIDEMASRFNA